MYQLITGEHFHFLISQNPKNVSKDDIKYLGWVRTQNIGWAMIH